MFAAERMHMGRMMMSLTSSKCHNLRNFVIITGERVVSLDSVATTAVLSLCSKTFRPRSCGRKYSNASRTANTCFHVMCCCRSSSYQNPRA
jgi:hypothetical protein